MIKFIKKIKIEYILRKYEITNYDLIEDEKYGYVVDVNGNVDLRNKNLKSINVKFNRIYGYFNCSSNELQTLKNCPNFVYGTFNFSNNKIKSLNELPRFQMRLDCSDNLLTIKEIKNLIELINKNVIQIEDNYINLKGNNNLDYIENETSFKKIKDNIYILNEKNEIQEKIQLNKVEKIKQTNKL